MTRRPRVAAVVPRDALPTLPRLALADGDALADPARAAAALRGRRAKAAGRGTETALDAAIVAAGARLCVARNHPETVGRPGAMHYRAGGAEVDRTGWFRDWADQRWPLAFDVKHLGHGRRYVHEPKQAHQLDFLLRWAAPDTLAGVVIVTDAVLAWLPVRTAAHVRRALEGVPVVPGATTRATPLPTDVCVRPVVLGRPLPLLALLEAAVAGLRGA